MKEPTTYNKSQIDWKRVDAMTDGDIDFSDCPEITSEMFANSFVCRGLKPFTKKSN